MDPNTRLTVSGAAHALGIHRSSIKRWLATPSYRLKKETSGLIRLGDVRRCMMMHRHGRPCGQRTRPETRGAETPAEIAAYFCEGTAGLVRMEGVLRAVAGYHLRAGRVDSLNAILSGFFR